MPIALTRAPSPSLALCELSFLERAPIDLERAAAQHREYIAALEAAGCAVITLPAAADLPDSIFVEDTAIIVDELAILSRPGAPSRRGELAAIAEALAPHRPLARLHEPATLDGGDVLRCGRTLYIGRSARTNEAAIDQVRGLLGPFGYSVIAAPVRACLHLKSAISELADGLLLANPAWVDLERFAGAAIVAVDPSEPAAANALRIGDRVIFPRDYPRTRARLADAGVAVIEVDASEVIKAEGAVTCCSLILQGPSDLSLGTSMHSP